MNRAKRYCSLLLAVLLLVTLLPAAAYAYPPDDDVATHKHNWVVTTNQPATCEEEGVSTWTCSLCSKTWTETSPALGHDWDDGVVTQEPEGWTPGVRTFTCKRDPSHTRTEAISPVAPLVWSQLGFVWPGFYAFDLHITVHPEDGRISRGGSDLHTMTVEAEGGTGKYTYSWYYTDNSGSVSPTAMDTLVMTGSAAAFSGYSGGSSAFLEAFASVFGDKEFANYPTVDLNSIPTRPDLFGSRSSGFLGEGEASYSASIGNCSYYCVVTDEAGGKAISNEARVEYRLGVRTQPKDTNLPSGGEATLFCEACDGTGDYSYTWLRADGSPAQGNASIPGTIIVQEPGDYTCVISDGVEEITTRSATVFEAETLAPVDWSRDVTKWPDEEAELFAEFTGGTPPYHCVWTKNGQTVGEDESDTPRFTLRVKDNASYLCTVTDDRGQSSWVTVRAGVRELAIARQPESCYLPAGGSAELSIQMAESGNYRYLLIRNADRVVVQENNTGVFQVDETGMYNIGVYEHAHPSHYALSNYAVVMDDVLRMMDQTESAVIIDPNYSVTLSVTVEGGSKPYTYYWFVYKDAEFLHDAGWYETGSNSDTIGARTPGKYYCRVKDAEDHWIDSHFIPVSYDGDAPLITLQPNDVYFEYSEESQAWGLICDAIPGKGGNAEDLIFEWYYRFPEDSDFSRVSGGRDSKVLGDVYYGGSGAAFPTWNCGWYYCKVTDPSTGKSTDSRVAKVNVKMEITGITRFGSFEAFNISCEFEGGTPPYTVSVFSEWETNPYDIYDTEYILYKSEENVMKSYVDFYHLDPMHDFCYWGKTDNGGMTLKYSRQFSHYRIDVMDALGQYTNYYGVWYYQD